jgi:hypothetical protein
MPDPAYYPITDESFVPEYDGAPLSYIGIEFAVPAYYGPTDPRAARNWETPTIVEATVEEAVDFLRDREWFESRVRQAATAEEEAREAFERAMADAHAAYRAAWSEYLPVHNELTRRAQATLVAFDAHEESMKADKARQDQQAQSDEDARLGAREYVIRRPRETGKLNYDSDVPTVHLVTCSTLKHPNTQSSYAARHRKPVRVAEAFEALMQGGALLATRGKGATWLPADQGEARLPGKVCGRCRAEVGLMAHDPVAYLAWRDQTESIQPDLAPSGRRLDTLFHQVRIPFHRYATQPNLWAVAGSTQEENYQRNGCIQSYETLIAWVHRNKDDSKIYASPGVGDHLEKLAESLAKVGLAVRRVADPANDQEDASEQLSDYYLAVRYMTDAEKRRRKEAR